MKIWKFVAGSLLFGFAGASVAFAEVVVSDAWVRGMVKGQTETGAFMTLKSTEATQLIQASSPIVKMVQIHEMSMDKDMMTMRPVKALDIPANKPVVLKPGAYHVMLIGLDKPLLKGELVPLKLTFVSKAGIKSTVDVQAEVHDLTQPNPSIKMDGMNMPK